MASTPAPACSAAIAIAAAAASASAILPASNSALVWTRNPSSSARVLASLSIPPLMSTAVRDRIAPPARRSYPGRFRPVPTPSSSTSPVARDVRSRRDFSRPRVSAANAPPSRSSYVAAYPS